MSDFGDGRRFWLTHELFKASIHPQKTVDLHGSGSWEWWGSLLAASVALKMELEYLEYLTKLGTRIAKKIIGSCGGHLGIHGTSLSLLSVFAHQGLGTDLTHPRGFRALQFAFLKEG